MKRIATALIVAAAFAASAFAADDTRTEKEAEAFVKNIVKLLASKPQATIDGINTGDKKWFDGELYPTINSIEGKSIANALNTKSAGKDISGLVDMNGKEFIKERIALAKTKGKFWHEYMWKDPVSNKVQEKLAYCERTGAAGEFIACTGIYKR